jgi:thiol:disulfide interchange protein
MKTFRNDFISKSILTIICGLAVCFSSCSNDDDDNGTSGSGVKTCYSIVDGQKDTYKYAFSYLDKESTDTKDVVITFTNLDYAYLYKHADQAASAESEELCLYLHTTDYQIPTGNISSDKYDIQVDRKRKLSDTDTPYQWYSLYGQTWNNHKTSDLVITKSGDTYKMELKDADFLASDPSSSDYQSVSESSRKTTGSFVFEGSLTDITSLVYSGN